MRDSSRNDPGRRPAADGTEAATAANSSRRAQGPPATGDPELIASWVTDADWVATLSFDLGLNPEFGPILADIIRRLDGNPSDDKLEEILGYVRWLSAEHLSIAERLTDPVKRWSTCRRAYFWYGVLEAITEASRFSVGLFARLLSQLGDEGLDVLGKIDNLNPSELTKLDGKAWSIDPKLLSLPVVRDYLTIKRWQDGQHNYHETILMPVFGPTRRQFDEWRARALPQLGKLSSRDALAGALLARDGLVPLKSVTRLLAAMPQSSLTAIVGGKAVGLARLQQLGRRIPETWVIPVGGTPTSKHLRALPLVSWAVRSSGTVEDGESTSFAGIFISELDIPWADLLPSIMRIRASVESKRVATYVSLFNTDAPHMAVVLQIFRGAQFAGVWIGNGIDGGRLEWVEGVGESLVSGLTTPHAEVWDGRSSDVLPVEIDGVPVGLLCLQLQAEVGKPLDLEWASREGMLWLQLRPVTRGLVVVDTTPEEPGSGDVLHGISASAGCVTGRVIQMASPSSPGWEAGAILIAQVTDPDWIEVMAGAIAIITAEGGATSHPAIIARELRIPGITAVPGALSIPTGATVEVNGDRGTVRIIS